MSAQAVVTGDVCGVPSTLPLTYPAHSRAPPPPPPSVLSIEVNARTAGDDRGRTDPGGRRRAAHLGLPRRELRTRTYRLRGLALKDLGEME